MGRLCCSSKCQRVEFEALVPWGWHPRLPFPLGMLSIHPLSLNCVFSCFWPSWNWNLNTERFCPSHRSTLLVTQYHREWSCETILCQDMVDVWRLHAAHGNLWKRHLTCLFTEYTNIATCRVVCENVLYWLVQRIEEIVILSDDWWLGLMLRCDAKWEGLMQCWTQLTAVVLATGGYRGDNACRRIFLLRSIASTGGGREFGSKNMLPGLAFACTADCKTRFTWESFSF